MAPKQRTSKAPRTPKTYCRYVACRVRFQPSRRSQKYHSDECRAKDWRLRLSRLPTALSLSFQLLDAPLAPNHIQVIVAKVPLEWIENWLKFYVAVDWQDVDFIDILSGAGEVRT